MNLREIRLIEKKTNKNGKILQVRCMRQGAQGWCTGMAPGDGMGREVGGRVRMGTHVRPWLIHVSVWQKPPQYCN